MSERRPDGGDPDSDGFGRAYAIAVVIVLAAAGLLMYLLYRP